MKRVKTCDEKKIVHFKWPDYIIHEGRKVWCCEKSPNFARFMLPMSHSFFLSKDQWLAHLKKQGLLD